MTVESAKHSSTEKVEYPSLQVDQRRDVELPAAIKSLEEEELQITELKAIEKTHLTEVVSHLKQAVLSLGVPVHIDPSAFSEVILTPDGKVSLVNNGSEITSMPLEKLPGSAMVSVLMQSVPELKRLLVEKKSGIGERATVLEKSAKEFRKVVAALPSSEKKKSDEPVSLDSDISKTSK